MGGDGSIVAKDAYGFTLHYFDEGNNHDYAAIGSMQSSANTMPSGFTSLFNDNIAAMNVNVPKIGQPVCTLLFVSVQIKKYYCPYVLVYGHSCKQKIAEIFICYNGWVYLNLQVL